MLRRLVRRKSSRRDPPGPQRSVSGPGNVAASLKLKHKRYTMGTAPSKPVLAPRLTIRHRNRRASRRSREAPEAVLNTRPQKRGRHSSEGAHVASAASAATPMNENKGVFPVERPTLLRQQLRSCSRLHACFLTCMHCVFILGAVMCTYVCCVCVRGCQRAHRYPRPRLDVPLLASCGVRRCGEQCIVPPPRVCDIDDLRMCTVRPLCSSSHTT